MQDAKLIDKTLIVRFAADDRGATALEYGLIVAVLSLVVAVATSSVGVSLTALFQRICDMFA